MTHKIGVTFSLRWGTNLIKTSKWSKVTQPGSTELLLHYYYLYYYTYYFDLKYNISSTNASSFSSGVWCLVFTKCSVNIAEKGRRRDRSKSLSIISSSDFQKVSYEWEQYCKLIVNFPGPPSLRKSSKESPICHNKTSLHITSYLSSSFFFFIYFY